MNTTLKKETKKTPTSKEMPTLTAVVSIRDKNGRPQVITILLLHLCLVLSTLGLQDFRKVAASTANIQRLPLVHFSSPLISKRSPKHQNSFLS